MYNKSKPKLYYIIADIIVLILIALLFIIMLINNFEIWQPITVAVQYFYSFYGKLYII